MSKLKNKPTLGDKLGMQRTGNRNTDTTTISEGTGNGWGAQLTAITKRAKEVKLNTEHKRQRAGQTAQDHDIILD